MASGQRSSKATVSAHLAGAVKQLSQHARKNSSQRSARQPESKINMGAQPPGSPMRGAFSRSGVEVPPAAVEDWIMGEKTATPLSFRGPVKQARALRDRGPQHARFWFCA